MVILRHGSFSHSILNAIYRAIAKTWTSSGSVQRLTHRYRRIQEGDCVLLRYKGQTVTLTSPLRVKGRTSTRVGEIAHDAIIGKQTRDVVVSSKDNQLRLHLPSLEEYVVLTPRLVTPIYSPDANLIISLLDLHPDGQDPAYESGIDTEILEAGTGHGALTLHLARAVHAANAGRHTSKVDDGNPAVGPGETGRRALIHTIDISPRYSEHATRVVGNVSQWIDQQMSARNQKPFLSHALLDLPSSYSYVEKAASALRVDGKLVLFNPSITQINKAIELVNTRRLPLQLERVVEVGPAMTGGRIWDVRLVKPRALTKEPHEKPTAATGKDDDTGVQRGEDLVSSGAIVEGSPDNNKECQMVCRPKVGDRVSGGGFVALWSKNQTRKDVR